MKKLLLLVASFLLLLPLSSHAQNNPPQSNITGQKVLGQAVASSFGQWSMLSRGVIASGVQTITLELSSFNVPAGMSIMPISTTIPIQINDGANTETVTPSTVNCSLGSGICTLTATFSKSHQNNFTVSSGTYGLQEAIAEMIQTGGQVLVTPDWKGTTAMITGAAGSVTVGILDSRGGNTNYYTWTGAAYVISLGISPSGIIGFVTGIDGSGTTNTLPKFLGTTTIGNSGLSDNGTTLTASRNATFIGGTISGNALSITSSVAAASMTASSNLALGTTPATAGAVRLSNNTFVETRNITNDGDLILIGENNAGNTTINAEANVILKGGTSTTLNWGGNSLYPANSSGTPSLGSSIIPWPAAFINALTVQGISTTSGNLALTPASNLVTIPSGSLSIGTSGTLNWNNDTFLKRDGVANIVALTDGTNPAVFRVYGNSFRYLVIGHDGTDASINNFGVGSIKFFRGTTVPEHMVDMNVSFFGPPGDGGYDLGGPSNRFDNGYFTTKVTAASFVITPLTTPADNAACTAGQFYVDTGFIYVCTANGTVKRAALSSF